jgi:DNA-binding LytR/AlgR family response regulator
MIRYILVDDDPGTLKYVKKKIDQLEKEFELKHVESYSSSKNASEKINPDDYDLLIVDYEMPVYNGIELAQKIAQFKKVIFLTSTVNNEKEIINHVNIAGFLMKPFDVEEFKVILKNKIINSQQSLNPQNKKTSYFLPIGVTKTIHINSENIYYISTLRNINGKQPDKNHVNIYGKEDSLLFENVRASISQLSGELGFLGFVKINQSTIVSRDHIAQRDNIHLSIFDCKETFSISDKEKSALIAAFKER